MAYNPLDLALNGINRFTSSQTVGYTLSSGEVIDVILDSDHPSFDPESGFTIGCAQVRIIPDDTGKSADSCQFYQPINQQNYQVPLIGEFVLLITGVSELVYESPSSTKSYYLAVQSIFSETSNNAIDKATTSEDGSSPVPLLGKYFPEATQYPLQMFEGDQLLQGRFGQAIRFTHAAQKSPVEHYWSFGKDDSPTLILSTGTDATKDDAIEKLEEGSHLILTRDINIEPDVFDSFNPLVAPLSIDAYSNNQIILTSDRVVIQSKDDALLLGGADTGIAMTTPDWQTDVNTLMNVVDNLTSTLNDLLTGQLTLNTAMGPTAAASNPTAVLQSTVDMSQMGS